MYPNTRETKLEMEGLLKAKNRIKRRELESGPKLGTGSIGTHHGKTESSCSPVGGQSLGAVSQIGGEKSNGFEGLAHQSVGPAQTDEMPKVHHDLAEEKQVVDGANATRFWTDLHRCYALAGLGVGHAMPWSEQVKWSQGAYPLVEKGVKHQRSPSPCLRTRREQGLWNSLGGLTPSSTQQPYGGGTHSEGRQQGNKGINKLYYFSSAGFHDCAHEQCREQLESAELRVDKVQSAERNWERRCVPPDKLDPDNTNQCHEEILGSGQKRLKAECNQKTIDHVPKSIYGQRTIMSLPGHKYCVPTYGGEVELYPVTTKDCNTQPLAERLLEMEKDRSNYNNVDVNPA